MHAFTGVVEHHTFCHISGKNVTLLRTKIFFLIFDVFCHILPEKRHILGEEFSGEALLQIYLLWRGIINHK